MIPMTVEEILLLYDANLIGKIEARRLLAHCFPSYASVMDEELNQHIRDEAELEWREKWQRLIKIREEQTELGSDSPEADDDLL